MRNGKWKQEKRKKKFTKSVGNDGYKEKGKKRRREKLNKNGLHEWEREWRNDNNDENNDSYDNRDDNDNDNNSDSNSGNVINISYKN